jgi:hypothetical protein
MKLRPRNLSRAILLLAGGLVLIAWLVPPYFHAGRYRRLLATGLENKLGRPVELGAVTFHLLAHPGFSIDHAVIKEDPRFGSEPFARVDRVECDLRWRSLWGSRLDCARILLEHPVFNLVRNGHGDWNVQDFLVRSDTVARIRTEGQEAYRPAGFHLDLEDARVNFTLGIAKSPLTVSGLTGELTVDPSSRAVRFDFTGTPLRADLPQPPPGAVELRGRWEPGKGFKGPLQATLHTSDSLLYGWIPLLAHRNPELYARVDATIQVHGSVDRLAVDGDVRLDQLHRWDSLPPLSAMPVGIRFVGSLDRTLQRFFVRQADVSFADSHFHVAGAIDRIGSSPKLDLVVGAQGSELEDIIAMAARLSGKQAGLDVSGRVDGLVTIQGPWRDRRYGGFIAVHSMQLQDRAVSISVARATVRINGQSAHLLPVHFSLTPHVECVAEGDFFLAFPAPRVGRASKPYTEEDAALPALPVPGQRDLVGSAPAALNYGGLAPRSRAKQVGHSVSQPSGHRYEITISAQQASLRELLRLARASQLLHARDIDAVGLVDGTLRLSGNVWPFGKVAVSAEADLHQARLLVPGLTEPVRLTRVHLETRGREIRVDPLVVGIGPARFSGWLRHEGARANAWQFDATAPTLSMEEASLWFAVLGHRKPMPILDLIPGLRSLLARRAAERSLFASLNARGRFDSPLVTFRSARLGHLRANLAIAGRVASIGDVAFQVAGGQGSGSARIDFRQTPALITGSFQLHGGELARIAWRLPRTLRGVRGRILMAGRFTTRGLTRQEMTAGLSGEAGLRLTNVSLGGFDPVEAFARAASLGSFQPDPAAARFRSLVLKLQIHDRRVIMAPLPLKFKGAVFNVSADSGFNGKADVYVRADLRGVRRQWVRARGPLVSAQELALSVPSRAPSLSSPPLPHGSVPKLAGIESSSAQLDPSAEPKVGIAAIHLAGAVNALAVVSGVAPDARSKSAPTRQVRW